MEVNIYVVFYFTLLQNMKHAIKKKSKTYRKARKCVLPLIEGKKTIKGDPKRA